MATAPPNPISYTNRANATDGLHGGFGYDTVQLDLNGSSAAGFVFNRTGANPPALDGVEQFIGTDGERHHHAAGRLHHRRHRCDGQRRQGRRRHFRLEQRRTRCSAA